MEKDTWEEFRYRFIETGWFDHDRTRTVIAMKKLWERVPQDHIDKLPSLFVFAPSADIAGKVFRSSTADQVFIYLSPMLESKSQAEVDAIVAHEFAHVSLGHDHPGHPSLSVPTGVHKHKDVASEQDADALISDWGYKPPWRGARRKVQKQSDLR